MHFVISSVGACCVCPSTVTFLNAMSWQSDGLNDIVNSFLAEYCDINSTSVQLLKLTSVEGSLVMDKLCLPTVFMNIRTSSFTLKWIHLFALVTQHASMKPLNGIDSYDDASHVTPIANGSVGTDVATFRICY